MLLFSSICLDTVRVNMYVPGSNKSPSTYSIGSLIAIFPNREFNEAEALALIEQFLRSSVMQDQSYYETRNNGFITRKAYFSRIHTRLAVMLLSKSSESKALSLKLLLQPTFSSDGVILAETPRTCTSREVDPSDMITVPFFSIITTTDTEYVTPPLNVSLGSFSLAWFALSKSKLIAGLKVHLYLRKKIHFLAQKHRRKLPYF